MRLYLVQHGEAKPKEEDPDRPLTEEGKQSCRSSASFLQSRGVRVPTIWHSGKLRAEQTAKILAEGAGVEEVARKDGLKAKDSLDEIERAIRDRTDDVMIVGHLPHLNRLASHLIAGREDADTITFHNAGVVCLGNEGGESWRIDWMIVPELLT
jgi:phosphohistidine phosphatase